MTYKQYAPNPNPDFNYVKRYTFRVHFKHMNEGISGLDMYVWCETDLAPLGVKTIFRPQKTLRSMLMQVKQKTPMEKKRDVV